MTKRARRLIRTDYDHEYDRNDDDYNHKCIMVMMMALTGRVVMIIHNDNDTDKNGEIRSKMT